MNRTHQPAPVDFASESAAGEEDPGASVDLVMPAAATKKAPGDQTPPGVQGAGENMCTRCGGSGKVAGITCGECDGTGKVTADAGGG